LPQPPLLAVAAALLWIDVCRALLIKTKTYGRSVLMFALMARDVVVFLVLAAVVAIGFTLVIFLWDELSPTMKRASSSTNCPFVAVSRPTRIHPESRRLLRRRGALLLVCAGAGKCGLVLFDLC
jgi:hypothetical protein